MGERREEGGAGNLTSTNTKKRDQKERSRDIKIEKKRDK